MSAYKVGELMTPDTVGSMGQQDADAVAITGGTIQTTTLSGATLQIQGASIWLHNVTTASALGGGTTASIVYVRDGDGGSPCIAVHDGSSYKRITLGATIST